MDLDRFQEITEILIRSGIGVTEVYRFREIIDLLTRKEVKGGELVSWMKIYEQVQPLLKEKTRRNEDETEA